MKDILCVSGGLDSYVAWHYLDKPTAIFFNAQHRYAEKEEKVVNELFPDLIVDESLVLTENEVGEKAYIHCRNLLFAIQASHYLPDEGGTVWMAGLKDDVVGDKSPEAFKLMGETMKQKH